MNNKLKTEIKKKIPRSFLNRLLDINNRLYRKELIATKKIFNNSLTSPSYLSTDKLDELQKQYGFLPDYGYDAEIVKSRGIERANEIMRFSVSKNAKSFLELGCWDGMVSYALHQRGKEVTAIDFRSDGFDDRAKVDGLRLLQMDASKLQFDDGSFDFVFSFDSFEHFSDPERVLKEAIRVVKKGGHIYLRFGPLYMSPYGEHAYRSITVPYCQFLFPKEVINDFTVRNNLNPIDFNHVNGWTVVQFKQLWNNYLNKIKKINYYEGKNLTHLNLIRKYPSCFKSKNEEFDNMIVESIEVLFEKIN